MGKRGKERKPKQRELRHRIEGRCSTCKEEYVGRVEKACPWCYQERLIHCFLLTILDED